MENFGNYIANKSINLTGNNRVLKRWAALGRQVISPLALHSACGGVYHEITFGGFRTILIVKSMKH